MGVPLRLCPLYAVQSLRTWSLFCVADMIAGQGAVQCLFCYMHWRMVAGWSAAAGAWNRGSLGILCEVALTT